MPVVALGLGLSFMQAERTKTAGRLMCFLGAQTGMTLYMKQVLSNAEVAEGRSGVPAAFAVTGLQQLVSFVILITWAPLSRFTGYVYAPKKVDNPRDWLAVFGFSFAFMMNIALNNYSVSLMPISVNLIIRSCFPLPTFVAQQLVSRPAKDGRSADSRPIELSLMLTGVFCAILAVVAKCQAGDMEAGETKYLILGVIVCCVSCIAGSLNLVLAGMLGSTLKLSEFDTIIYTALPAALLLLIPMSMPHTVPWDGGVTMTDWEILAEVCRENPSTLLLAALSGVFALILNLAKYSVVQSLSATHAAFAGNFNKAFTIVLAMMLGFEPAPSNVWGVVMVLACMGNIGAFTAYNLAKLWHVPEAHGSALLEEKQRLNSVDSTETRDLSSPDDIEVASDSSSGLSTGGGV
jgi:hypothetical protein